ncbi:AMP-dependent synthetase [Afipia sp. P52-10]|uniref:class I adenylate-forming enzyme family protein n=1 Tax=Afipia sp. P52-10 TaxID=1429916 RepID=UPI0003DF2F17|nr:class I adenylate-forming enzyme family protein [Afipia sp. P52-10]ETR76897.1 AMP-dependent synthetase [Afipia sp. P52-10]
MANENAAHGGQHAASADVRRAGHVSVYELFRSRARREPDALAIEEGAKQLSYRQLHARVCRTATLLRQYGVQHGDRIALLSENRAEYLEVQLAAARIGAIVACQNWRLASAELQHCINLVTPKLVVVSERYAPALASLDLGRASVVAFGVAYDTTINALAPDTIETAVDPEDGLVILYTSGTTGLPKGALISHRAEIARNAVLRMDMGATDRDGFVAWAPMFHMGSTDQALGAIMSGAAVIIIDGFDAEAIVDAVARHRIGWLLLMPGSIEPVVNLLQQRPMKVKGVRVVGAMADLLPTKLIAALSGLIGAPFLNSFGSTETGLPPASGTLIPPGIVPHSLSKRQSALCDVKLVDPDNNEVADGEPGEVAIRGPTVFSGYWNAPETNARDFAGGWFRMGDLFRRNPDNSFDFVDRAKYMIKSGGENVYPAEIERVLLADPRVADAVVVRKRDARWGEVPVAFVARLDAALSEADIEAMCRRELASYKRPKHVHFVAFEDLPRSTTGKIQRHEVEKWL